MDAGAFEEAMRMRSRNQRDLGFCSPEAIEVFERWREALGSPRSRLDPTRAKAIDGMLSIGYSVEDLQLAIFGCSISPYHQGQNDRRQRYTDIELICRDAQHVDKFIELAEREISKQVERASEPPGRLLDRPASKMPDFIRAMVKKRQEA